MNNEKIFGMDLNLGFNNDLQWQQFNKKFDIKISSYESMNQMLDDMKKHQMMLCYVPTATFFYMKDDPYYTPIANALFASNGTSKIRSLLIVSKKSQVNQLSDLRGKSLGYINLFCTSSYFAPAILLMKNHFSLRQFFSDLKQVGAWQLQIDAVIKGEVDATMIQEDVWYRLPSNAENTKIIAIEENLPSPLILSAPNINETMSKPLNDLLFSHHPRALPNALFNGFIPFQREQVSAFLNNATKAFMG